jgi:glycosyltransferase involved in cell wall biosynthesis
MNPIPVVVHLRASRSFAGAERQILGLAEHLAGRMRQEFFLFAEEGFGAFAERLSQAGHRPTILTHDSPRFLAVWRELQRLLRRIGADILCCHGYKADLMGWAAARAAGVAVVSILHGWTSQSVKVCFYETLDRWSLRWMDRVVCVCKAQAEQVRRRGLTNLAIIPNAIPWSAPHIAKGEFRERMLGWFGYPCQRLVGMAARLSPEKGVGVFLEAARYASRRDPALGFVVFGDGALRHSLTCEIATSGLANRFVLAGFQPDLADYLANLDLMVIPSLTEALPCVLLEAMASQVPVIATAVGGIPEVIEDGVNGYLVSPGQPAQLADRIIEALSSPVRSREIGRDGQRRVLENWTFHSTAPLYERLFRGLLNSCRSHDAKVEPTRSKPSGAAKYYQANSSFRLTTDFPGVSPTSESVSSRS